MMRYFLTRFGPVILTLIIFGLGFWALSDTSETLYCPTVNNAAWISVDWTSQPANELTIEQLAQETSRRKIRYLYPFTTYVRENGFSPSYDYAEEFVSTFKKFNQQTYLLAWVGIPLKRTRDVGLDGWTNLKSDTERREIVEFVSKLVKQNGFDGVHLNVETVWAGDTHYLLFLEEMKEALGEEYILSVSGHTWRATEAVDANDYRWDSHYYQAVGNRTDQLVAMTYDSMAQDVNNYEEWLKIQIDGIGKSLHETKVELLLGLSVSREQTLTHNPAIENMANSLHGICSVLVKNKELEVADGLAIYAAWEASSKDWTVWENYFYEE